MKKQDFEILVQAGAVEKVVIMGSLNPHTNAIDWSIWAYGGEAVFARDNGLRTSRGDLLRFFSSLDTAYRFVRGVGYKGQVFVEDTN